MGHVTDEGRNDDARKGREGVGDAHEGAGEGRGDVDMVGEEAGVHGTHKHGAKGQECHGQVSVAADVGDAEEAYRWGHGGCKGTSV